MKCICVFIQDKIKMWFISPKNSRTVFVALSQFITRVRLRDSDWLSHQVNFMAQKRFEHRSPWTQLKLKSTVIFKTTSQICYDSKGQTTFFSFYSNWQTWLLFWIITGNLCGNNPNKSSSPLKYACPSWPWEGTKPKRYCNVITIA